MPPEAPTPLPQRASAVDRELVVRRLQEGWLQERLSLDTFSARVEAAHRARSRAQLDELIDDLRERSALGRAISQAVARVSAGCARLVAAWRRPQTERLALPITATVTLGRAPECDCLLNDPTVSRRHARLSHRDGTWLLRDLRSTNGTRVNGWRVVDEVEVRAGDTVSFGAATYRLGLPSAGPHA